MMRAIAALLLASANAKYPLLYFDEALSPPPPPPRGIAADRLPTSFSWRRVAGYGSLLTPSLNQHVPTYCGACFAFASVHALQDRVKIARALSLRAGAAEAYAGPDLLLAVQVLLNCGGEDLGWGLAGSCAQGGSSSHVYRFVQNFGGLPAAGCFPYLAEDGLGCAPDAVCRNCMPGDGGESVCWAVPGDADGDFAFASGAADVFATSPYPRVAVSHHGRLPSALDVGPGPAARAMQLEIARAGPVTCDVDADAFVAYRPTAYGRLVAESPWAGRGLNATDHVIEVVGWGVDETTAEPYWEIRNSWGEYWGDLGFARVRRGTNDALIESGCTWVHPSGWGVPKRNWHANELGQHDAAAAQLLEAVATVDRVREATWESSAEGGWPSRKSLAHVLAVAIPVLGVAVVFSCAVMQPVVQTRLSASEVELP